MIDPTTQREAMVDFLRRELVGPASEHEEIPEPPHPYYVAGVLFPQEEDADATPEDEVKTSQSDLDDEVYDHKPSAMGLSFVVPRSVEGIAVRVSASYYEETEDTSEDSRSADTTKDHGSKNKSVWTRRPLPVQDSVFANHGEPGAETTEEVDCWTSEVEEELSPRARLHVRWRRPISSDEDIVTVTLVNMNEAPRWDEPDCSIHLFQCKIEASLPGETRFQDMRGRTSIDWSDPEEDELTLIYRDRQVYASGHGCSVSWDHRSPGGPKKIETQTIPAVELPGVDFKRDEIPAESLSWGILADQRESTEKLVGRLQHVRKGYMTWIKTQEAMLAALDYPDGHRLHSAGKRLLERMRSAAKRIRAGIQCLEDDPAARTAFRIANLAILMQRKQVEGDRAGGLHDPGDSTPLGLDLFDPEVARSIEGGWRPFQLAFFLMVLPSLVDPARKDREVVDLLWFPTGGGKTEAYLGLAAFEIFRRRLASATGDGTVVLKRYTYRVLTFQQFERAGAVICACELIRRSRNDLGEEPITIGMWVGGSNTPNRRDAAIEMLPRISAEENPFQIRKCPWCGTKLMGERRGENRIEEHRSCIRFRCRDPRCPFGRDHCGDHVCQQRDECIGIPMLLVDDDLYDYPPSMVVATIDKFAQLPWLEEVGRLFGDRGTGSPDRDPPSLFIQDELHLINGSLGTLAAMFEAAIDVICERRGARPKIIGATATLRRGGEQCRGLYGRDPVEEVLAFPPSGISADDSYFMRLDHDSPGRLYLGLMGQGQKSTEVLSSILSAAAMGAVDPSVVDPSSELGVCDGYWTTVVYHNSLAELGRTLGLTGREVPQRMQEMEDRARRAGFEAGSRGEHLRSEPLSGQTASAEIPVIMDRLDRIGTQDDAIDVLCCTSIVGVGVDKSRLGLMVMHGQPGTTAEYIQASSRVGRGAMPGIVVANLSANRARDLSHYESFQAYHGSIYRFVEPTSVTPFTTASRERALSAAMVAAFRHGLPAPKNHEAGAIDLDSKRWQEVRALFLHRCCRRASSLDQEALSANIDELLNEWKSMAEPRLRYASHLVDRNRRHLLRPDTSNDTKRGRWPAPNSLRLVDRSCDLRPLWGGTGEREDSDV